MTSKDEHDQLPTRLGIVLKRLRENAGQKQGESAVRAGLSAPMLSRWEQGDLSTINLVKLSRLARCYDTNLTHLFRMVEEAPADSLEAVDAWLASLQS